MKTETLMLALSDKDNKRRLKVLQVLEKHGFTFEMMESNLKGNALLIIRIALETNDIHLIRYYLFKVLYQKNDFISNYMNTVMVDGMTLSQIVRKNGDFLMANYLDAIQEMEKIEMVYVSSTFKLQQAIPELKIIRDRSFNYYGFQIVLDCGSRENLKRLSDGFLAQLSNNTVLELRFHENSSRILLGNIADMGLEKLNEIYDGCINQLMGTGKHGSNKSPEKLVDVNPTNKKKKKKKKKKCAESAMGGNVVQKTPIDYQVLQEKLDAFTQKIKDYLFWEKMKVGEELRYHLPSSSGLCVGLVRDHFVENGVGCRWSSENGLVLSANSIHSDLSQRSDLLSAKGIEKIKSVQKSLDVLRSIILPLVNILLWSVSEDGYVAVVQSRTDNLKNRLHNLRFLFQDIWQSCALVEDDSNPWVRELKDEINHATEVRVCLQGSELRSDKLLQFCTDANKIKEYRRFSQVVGELNRDLADLNDFKGVCANSEKARMQSGLVSVKEQKRVEERKPDVISALSEDNKKRVTKKKNNTKKSNIAESKNRAQPTEQKKKKEPRKQLNIPPQPEERRRDPAKIRDDSKVSNVQGMGITMDYFRQAPVTELSHNRLVAELDILPEGIHQKERKAWVLLDLLFTKMQKLILLQRKYRPEFSEECITVNQSLKMGRFLAGWHYLHAQISNLLSSRFQSDFVKTILFEHYAYDFHRQYQRQKHDYFPPPCFNAKLSDFDLCFQDISALQAALGFIIENKFPQEESIVLIRKLISDWGHYIEREYTREDRDIRKIIKKMSPEEFGEWLFDSIMKEAKHLFQVVKDYQNCKDNEERESIELEMRFYVDRIGELRKHIPCYRDQNNHWIAQVPFQQLSAFLEFCRLFRNPTSHTYSQGLDDYDSDEENTEVCLEEPALNIEALIQFREILNAVVSPKAKPSFFDQQKEHARKLPRRVRAYQYRAHDDEKAEHDITCLTRLRVRESLNIMLNQKEVAIHPMPIAVSEPIMLSEKADLYANPLVNKAYKDLCAREENEDQCLLLIPLMITNDHQVKIPSTVALCMLFKRDEKKLINLTKISYACVTNQCSQVEDLMKSFQQRWLATTKQVNEVEKPREVQLKSIDASRENDIPVLQVELLVRLAEQQICKNSHSSRFPESKKKKNLSQSERMAMIIRQFRQDHLRLWWLEGMQHRYLEQLLKGTDPYPPRDKIVEHNSSRESVEQPFNF